MKALSALSALVVAMAFSGCSNGGRTALGFLSGIANVGSAAAAGYTNPSQSGEMNQRRLELQQQQREFAEMNQRRLELQQQQREFEAEQEWRRQQIQNQYRLKSEQLQRELRNLYRRK